MPLEVSAPTKLLLPTAVVGVCGRSRYSYNAKWGDRQYEAGDE